MATNIGGTMHRAWVGFRNAWTSHGADISKGAIGALIGAMLAFSTERHFRDDEAKQGNFEAGLLVLAPLESMEQTLLAVYCGSVMPHRGSKRAWLDLESHPVDFPDVDSALDAPSLSFLLPTAGPKVYEQLWAAHSAYRGYGSLVNRRNRVLWDVIYPVTDKIRNQERGPDFDRRVARSIGTSPIELANQTAIAMLGTHDYMNVVSEARFTLHSAMLETFPDDMPEIVPPLWPAGSDTPRCELIKREGNFSRYRAASASPMTDN